MNFEDFLQEIVGFINEATGRKRNDVLQQGAENIVAYYAVEKKKGLYGRLEEALGNDLELYYLVLSTLQFITKDAECVAVIENLLLRPDLDLLIAYNVWFQLSNIRFRDISIPYSYSRSRQINKYLLERYEREYPMEVPFVPYKERNRKRIVIETDTLLTGLHAPTHIILDTCQTLIRDMGYEVLLIVNVAWMDLNWMNRFWLFPYVANYRKDINGRFSIAYEDVVVQGYQLQWKKESMPEMKQLLQEVHEWNPLCVWHIGSASFRHDIYRRMTTLLSMPCTDGYSVSEAPVLVSYMQSDSANVKESIGYAERQGQKRINIERVIEHKEQGKNYHKEDFMIPEEAFVICIVGTRLDAELSEAFMDILYQLERELDNLHFMIIGISHQKPFCPADEKRVHYLGYREDLVDVIKVADLFVNPPRQGGGSGAVRAFSVGVPAISLPDCDVANLIGEDFCCQSLKEMKEEIIKYVKDEDFYKNQQEKARKKYAKRMSVSNAKSYQTMLQQLEEWLEKGEVL